MNRLIKDLDSIHAKESTKAKTLNYVLAKQNRKNQKPYFISFIIITTLILLVFIPTTKKTQLNAFISMDINPSFEFEINQDYMIVNIKEYNEDGKKFIQNKDYIGGSLDNVLISLLSDKEYSQYLKNGILEVSVFSKNQQFSTQIEEYMKKQLTDKQVEKFHCSQIDEDTHQSASQHHMSAGKYQVIQKILENKTKYSQEELKAKSMKDLYNILQDINPDASTHNGHNKNGHNGKHK